MLALCAGGCARSGNEVVVYSSLDQVFSEPILKDFQHATGIRVRAVYDVEATKTTGLVNRLIAEQPHPQADVFWNSEIARTIILKDKGVLTPYTSANASEIPEHFKDPHGYWAGFAARARILIYHKELVAEDHLPRSIFELTSPAWRGKVALANPLFGTTSTQVASLSVLLGREKAEQFLRGLKANAVAMVDGNSTSRDMVAAGEMPIGFTDTDDAHVAIVNGKPVGVIYPDQGEGQIGTLLIPNTVGLIKGGPHPDNGKRLIDYLLSKETESKLAFASSAQIPLRDDAQRPPHVPSYRQIRVMDVDFEQVAHRLNESAAAAQEIFIR
ncbi:MAG: extracellular solute-binding protein [Candidatus Omnitrophica bacterium]|nr:extracellular solute-binding protein [Candidatus Omnitrophota bacterium]